MEHCPDRFDFGFRYLDRDLPTAERALIDDLSTTGDLESIDGLRTQAFAVFERQRIRVGEMLTDAL